MFALVLTRDAGLQFSFSYNLSLEMCLPLPFGEGIRKIGALNVPVSLVDSGNHFCWVCHKTNVNLALVDRSVQLSTEAEAM